MYYKFIHLSSVLSDIFEDFPKNSYSLKNKSS